MDACSKYLVADFQKQLAKLFELLKGYNSSFHVDTETDEERGQWNHCGLLPVLHIYQRRAVRWMLCRENAPGWGCAATTEVSESGHHSSTQDDRECYQGGAEQATSRDFHNYGKLLQYPFLLHQVVSSNRIIYGEACVPAVVAQLSAGSDTSLASTTSTRQIINHFIVFGCL